MKAKLQIPSAIVALSMATPAFARTHVVQTRSGQRVVTNVGNDRDHWHSSSSGVSWNIGIGLPFYGGYYGGYPYYGGSLLQRLSVLRIVRVFSIRYSGNDYG